MRHLLAGLVASLLAFSGDLVDALDNTLLTSASGAPLSVSTNLSGAVRVLSPQGAFLGPIE